MRKCAQLHLLPIIAVVSLVSASTAVAARRPFVIADAIVRPSPVPTAQLVRQEVAVNPAPLRREIAVKPAPLRREVAVIPAPVTPAEVGTQAAPPLRRAPIIIIVTKKAVASAL